MRTRDLSDTVGSFGVDPENSMIFAQDYFVGGVYGIKLNQKTGAMKVVWSRPDWRNSDYFTVVGPPDQRVLISQHINPSTTFPDVAQCLAANQCTYDRVRGRMGTMIEPWVGAS